MYRIDGRATSYFRRTVCSCGAGPGCCATVNRPECDQCFTYKAGHLNLNLAHSHRSLVIRNGW